MKKETTSSTCLNIELLQETSDALWRDESHGYVVGFLGWRQTLINTYDPFYCLNLNSAQWASLSPCKERLSVLSQGTAAQ